MARLNCKFLIFIMLAFVIFGYYDIAFTQESDDNVDTDAVELNSSLGDILSENMQNMLRAGNIFLPNGESAQPINPDETDQPERFSLNFNNAGIDQVLKFLSDLSDKVVLKADEVDGRVTIMSPNEVTKEEALGIIDAAFMLKGYTFLESDQSIIVIPMEQAKQRGVNVNVGLGGETSGSRVETRMIELQYASPSQIRNSLSSLLSENANIVADDRTQTLVITDTTSNINRLSKIIEQLDKQDNMQGIVIRVFQLRYLDADELDNNLDNILQNIVLANRPIQRDSRGRIQNRAPIEVLADETSNSLIVSAPQDAIDEVARFIENLDTRGSDILQERLFTLENGDAEDVASTLQELAEARESNVYRPAIVADTRTNTVIISGYIEDIDAFENLINLLDSKISYDEVVEVYPLENSDAIILAEMITNLLGSENQQTNWWNRNNQDESEIKIVQDQRLNALVVTAKPSDLPRVERLIEKLDEPIPQSKEEPRIYPVKYVRASDVAMLINQLFQDNQMQLGGGWNRNNQQTQLTGLSGKVRVISDPTTNSIIVIASTPRAFSVVESLIEQLDKMTPEFSTTKVFRLNNANADYLQEKLTALFQDTNQGQGGNQGFFWFMNQGANQEQKINNLIGNVRIESETRTNSLLVTTNSQYFDTIEELISELDKEIEQIQVEILILEIQDISDSELGIDWDGSVPITIDGSYESGANNFNKANFGVLAETQMNMVLNYLASTNKTNVLARPNILTGDNSSAFVEAINRVPRPDQFTFGTTVDTQSIVYEEVGLKLTVRPQINDASTVTINVDLENGSIIDQFSLTSANSSIPAFTRRTVQTILTVNNAETAVLSGVINTQFVDTEKGIPGLMHIPLLGNLFKTKGTSKNKTELMAFITPYILSDQSDREEALYRQQQRLQLYEGLGNQLKDVQVDFGVIEEEVVEDN